MDVERTHKHFDEEAVKKRSRMLNELTDSLVRTKVSIMGDIADSKGRDVTFAEMQKFLKNSPELQHQVEDELFEAHDKSVAAEQEMERRRREAEAQLGGHEEDKPGPPVVVEEEVEDASDLASNASDDDVDVAAHTLKNMEEVKSVLGESDGDSGDEGEHMEQEEEVNQTPFRLPDSRSGRIRMLPKALRDYVISFN
jgi:hypothetical protein